MAADVVLVTSPDALEAHVPAWDDLASEALEPNVFQEAWMALPGWRAFGASTALQALLVYDDERLDGLFLLERLPRFHGLPMPVLRSWTHQYSPLGTPLVRSTAAFPCLNTAFTWLASDAGGAPIFELVEYGADGPFHEAVQECARQRGLARFDVQAFQRAVLRQHDGASAAMSSSSRRELRRQHRRLEESGHLELRALQPGADLNPWIRAFLDLERSGWKGRTRTALASDPVHQAFFEQIAREGHRRGRMQMLGLFLDDRPVAMKCNLVAPPGAFAWKIAFDEHFAAFSPGVQLELDSLIEFDRHREIDWIDSCTSEGPAMIDRLWSGRRAIADTVVSTGRSAAARLLVQSLDPLRRLYRKVRRPVSPRAAPRSAPSSPAAAGIAQAAQPDPAGRP